MSFTLNKQAAGKPESEGQKFLTQAKARHAELFGKMLEECEEYSSVETYTQAVEQASWKLTELLTKESWRNGIARGRGRNQARS
jgi:hypothetical protein